MVTTRPPAIAGRREQLASFKRFPIAPMEQRTIENYLDRWLSVQVHEPDERHDVRGSFERRQNETHVKALAKNPMQLSVLLHFIRLKGEAFPDRRAELYRDYFRIVIDRDVEKSSELRQKRELIETLHQLLGYRIHSLTEADKADGTLRRTQLLEIVQDWMRAQGMNPRSADEIFRLGEERLGLIVALRGEGEETRYGYEIQPIREYFAAAYINEQIQGDAHEVFQSLVVRPYWKEVALFLAGLRRPNEKADLVTRAKAIDQNSETSWRHDGRAIILQLLQEGVFSQPSHVFVEAVDFIIDLLDPSVVSVPSEPKEMLDVLPGLVKQGDSQRHVQRILGIIERNSADSDEYTTYRPYRVLSKIVQPKVIKEALLRYNGADHQVFSNLRILWPYTWGLDMKDVAGESSFWRPLREEIAATSLWNAAMTVDLTTGIPMPPSLHSQLFERYVTASDAIFDSGPDPVTIMEPQSNWAIWTLVSLQQALLTGALGMKTSESKRNLYPASPLDFRGLDPDVKDVASRLTTALQELIRTIFKDGERDITAESLASYTSTIAECLDRSGLAGLIACRTGMNMLELYRFSSRMPHRSLAPALHGLAVRHSLRHLSLGLSPFFGRSIAGDDEALEEDAFSSMYQRMYEMGAAPTHFRLENAGPFVDMSDLLAENLCNGKDLPFSWLGNIPISSALLRPLVDKCRSCLPQLLITLSERQFEATDYGRPLLVQNMQRILKLARVTEDTKLLEGTFLALSSSKFLNLAGPELTLRLIRSTRSKSSVVQKLFSTSRTNPKEINVLTNCAKRIVEEPNDFPLGTRIAAANYLAEHIPVIQPPLLTFENDLGLQIQKRAGLN